MTDSTPHNPLDEALRRELADYGEAPSQRVWAGVRRNLPTAPPLRPRWRRKLPVLLLGLLPLFIGTLALLIYTQSAFHKVASPAVATISATRSATQASPATASPGANSDRATAAPVHHQADQTLPALTIEAAADARSRQVEPPSATVASNTKKRDRTGGISLPASGSVAAAFRRLATTPQASNIPVAAVRRNPGTIQPKRQTLRAAAAVAGAQISAQGRETSGKAAGSLAKPAASAAHSGASSLSGLPVAQSSILQRGDAATKGVATGATLPPKQPSSATTAGISEESAALHESTPADEEPAFLALSQGQRLENSRLGIDQLAYALAKPLPTLQLPTSLDGSPDSVVMAKPVARRWALQLAAGPTLSYRQLSQPKMPDYTSAIQLERPAVGMGAQVQLRGALSGRWALAAGVGFQQYASSLSIQVVTTRNMGAVATTSVASVQNRDTYNLLVLPVQLSYALGAGGRWQLAALGGLEPGLYLGGRSTAATLSQIPQPNTPPNSTSFPTIAANYGFTQRTYSGPAASPYRSWNLALSLGLDLRFRPAPASRWQLLVQPVGRYVVTPFMRETAVDYSRRPFSFGLLGGFSWDVR